MIGRIVKIFALAIGAAVAILIIGVGVYLVIDYVAYQKVEITTALLRNGKYDPSQYFTFDRACVFPPESSLADTWLSQRGYHQLDTIFPDTYTNWTLVLIDDNKKTFRTLYVLEPKVKFGGQIICNSKITLQTVAADGFITAYVKEASAH
jgi:hypothetical protein